MAKVIDTLCNYIIFTYIFLIVNLMIKEIHHFVAVLKLFKKI